MTNNFFYEPDQIPIGLNVKTTCARVFVCVCLCTCVGACMCVRACIDEHAYMSAYECVRMHTYVYGLKITIWVFV